VNLRRAARLLGMAPRQGSLLLEALLLLRTVSLVLRHGSGKLTGRLLQRASTARSGPADEAQVAARWLLR